MTMKQLPRIRYSGTVTRRERPDGGSACPTCRRLGWRLTPPLWEVWPYYCADCQQLFMGIGTSPCRLKPDTALAPSSVA